MSTIQVAKLLDVPIHALHQAITNNRMRPPDKGPGGNFIWTTEDIERASWAICHKAFTPEDCSNK